LAFLESDPQLSQEQSADVCPRLTIHRYQPWEELVRLVGEFVQRGEHRIAQTVLYEPSLGGDGVDEMVEVGFGDGFG
jgi:hypothetical protein